MFVRNVTWVLLFGALVGAEESQAQSGGECGSRCEACPSGGGFEGTHWVSGGRYNMQCVAAPTCTNCLDNSLIPEPDLSARALVEMTGAARRAWLRRNRDRASLVGARRLLVIEKQTCVDGASLVVLRLPEDVFRDAEAVGLRERRIESAAAETRLRQ